MGVDVSAVTMIGIRFESVHEAEEFVREHYNVSDDEEFDIDNFYEITKGLTFEAITQYSDKGGVLGVEVVADELDEEGNGVRQVWKKVRELLPASSQDTVGAHVWAQYW